MDDDREPNDLALVAMLCDPAMTTEEAELLVRRHRRNVDVRRLGETLRFQVCDHVDVPQNREFVDMA